MKLSPSWALALALLAFFALAAQSKASPPVTPPEGSLGFVTMLFIEVEGSVNIKENYYWAYEEGQGNFQAITSGTDAQGHPIIITPGFQEAAVIFWEQEYTARNGRTSFSRIFAVDPERAPTLNVRTDLGFKGDPFAGSSLATYREEVGLSVISVGGDDFLGNAGSGVLSLCPWATRGNREIGGGYPAATAIIGAGSSFRVERIAGFGAEATVISTDVPFLQYSVGTPSGGGEGFIDAWFAVDLWEANSQWGSHDIGIHNLVPNPTGTYAINDPPPLASRTSYSENASAAGVWSFAKKVSYQSVLLKSNPFFLVP